MILVAGEALMDMLPVRATDGSAAFRPVAGGSPFNVALALGRLQVPVGFLCCLSGDAFGQVLSRALSDSGVDLSLCPRVDALTPLGFATVDPDSREAVYSFYTEATAGCAFAESNLPDTLPRDVACCHFGSFSIGQEPFGSALECLLNRVSERRLISVDPNIRPFLVGDRRRYEARLQRFFEQADMIKASVEDLGWLYPNQSPDACAARFMSWGARLVTVPSGADGAMAWTASGHAQVKAPRVTVVDTVGAGDSFQAALFAWLRESGRLRKDGLNAIRSD